MKNIKTSTTAQSTKTNLVYAAIILVVAFFAWIIPETPFEDRLAELPHRASSIDNTIYDHEKLSQEWFDPKGFARGLHVLNQARIEYFYKVIQERFEPLSKRDNLLTILDVGCGGGIGTEKLFSRDFAGSVPNLGFNITGIEPSIRSVQIAKNHYHTTEIFSRLVTVNHHHKKPSLGYFVGSAYDLSMYEDESVDVVISSDVMDHLFDVRQAMREANRVLKKDGIFIFETINRTWSSYIWVQKLGELVGLIPRGTHDYRLFMTIDEVERLISEESDNQMKVKEITGTKVSVGMGWEKFDLSRYIDGVHFSFEYPWPQMVSAEITGQDTSIGIIGYAVKSV